MKLKKRKRKRKRREKKREKKENEIESKALTLWLLSSQYIYRLLSICIFSLSIVSLPLLLSQPDMSVQKGNFENLPPKFSLLSIGMEVQGCSAEEKFCTWLCFHSLFQWWLSMTIAKKYID